MARNRYWVVPAGSNWQVKYLQRVLSTHILKSQAIDEGRKVAKANQPSQLTILKQNGQIETEYTYGDDPYPPPG
ncbi:MAG: hypothetical protein CME34_19580 [Gordonia sp.]|uniref:DUF2188 domain-containing protein n=1 Tax=Gordonia sp. (in: high G+C Gram-positive bacteria) TaxID=84139 RepID=UPI000C52BF3E|nr:DUF2188 domain-containing protein [Gordonia sp. (in: high G+C Gram-positive bacteria)]MAU84026.1 hypothetical protein [Gordonia sp. (in: high G+C Gram-positive bacteria)]